MTCPVSSCRPIAEVVKDPWYPETGKLVVDHGENTGKRAMAVTTPFQRNHYIGPLDSRRDSHLFQRGFRD